MQVNGNSTQVVFHLFIPTLSEFVREDTYQGALWLLVGNRDDNAVETSVMFGVPRPDTIARRFERLVFIIGLKTQWLIVNGEPVASARSLCSHRVPTWFSFLAGAVENE